MIVLWLLWAQLPGSGLGIDASSEVDAAVVARVRGACAEIGATLAEPGEPRITAQLRLEQAATVEDFVRRTRRARFDAAALVGRTIWLQPMRVLDRLPDVDGVLRHECVHALLRAHRVAPLDPLYEEAVALVVAGQAPRLPPAPLITAGERAALSRELAKPSDRARYEHTLARAASTYGPRIAGWLRARTLLRKLREPRAFD